MCLLDVLIWPISFSSACHPKQSQQQSFVSFIFDYCQRFGIYCLSWGEKKKLTGIVIICSVSSASIVMFKSPFTNERIKKKKKTKKFFSVTVAYRHSVS